MYKAGQSCKVCFFWLGTSTCGVTEMVPDNINDPDGKQVIMGICRKRAPNPHFGFTREDDWCGDFAFSETFNSGL